MLLINSDTQDQVTILLHFYILISSISHNIMFALIADKSTEILVTGGAEFKKESQCIVTI